MKMSPEHYSILEKPIKKLMDKYPVKLWHEKSFSNTRYRWDLFHAAMSQIDLKTNDLYHYLNDSHIDTALRKITNTK